MTEPVADASAAAAARDPPPSPSAAPAPASASPPPPEMTRRRSSIRRLSLSLLQTMARTPDDAASSSTATTNNNTTTAEMLGSFKRRFSLGKPDRRSSHLVEPGTARLALPGSSLPMAARSEHHRSILQRFQLRRVSTSRSFSSLNRDGASRFAPATHPTANACTANGGGVRRGQLLAEIRARVLEPLAPDSAVQRLREIALVLTLACQVLYLPFAAAYIDPPVQTAHVLFELVWLLDFALAFHTVTLNERQERVTSHREIAWRFLLRRGVFVDAAAALPLDTMTLLGDVRADVHNSVVRYASFTLLLVPRALKAVRGVHLMELLRAARGIRLARELWKWLQYSRYSHLLRIVRLVLGVLVAVHYMACVWELIRDHHDDDDSTATTTTESLAQRHFANLNYCILLFQGGPPDLTAGSVGQNVFAISAVLLGSLILAIVFGNVAMLVSNFYANATNYQRKMEAVVAVMRKMQLPPELRDRIHQYYEHLWREYESLDGNIERFSKQLTHTLALEVGLFKYMELIMNVPFWGGCSPDFISQIILHLEVRVYLPDDYVVRKGEMGDKLFMLNRGLCELLHLVKTRPQPAADARPPSQQQQLHSHHSHHSSRVGMPYLDVEDDEDNAAAGGGGDSDDSDDSEREGREWTRSMFFGGHQTEIDVGEEEEEERAAYRFRPGESFGELSLLMNYRRTASVRAVGFVEMCLLNRVDFQKIIARYPSDRRRVLRAIIQRCIRNNVFKDVPFPWEEIGRHLRDEFPRAAPSSFSMTGSEPSVESSADVKPSQSTSPPPSSVAIFGGDWTADEISEALVQKLDAETRDASIIFGFQPADLQPRLGATTATPRPPQGPGGSEYTSVSDAVVADAPTRVSPSDAAPLSAADASEDDGADHTGSQRSLCRVDSSSDESAPVVPSDESPDLQTVVALLEDIDWLTERVQSLEASQSQLLDTLVTVGHALVSLELRLHPSQPEARALREQLERVHTAIRTTARSPVALVRAHRRHRTVAVARHVRPAATAKERRRVSVAGFEHAVPKAGADREHRVQADVSPLPSIRRRMVMTDMRGRRSVAGDQLLAMDASLQSHVRMTGSSAVVASMGPPREAPV